MADSFWYLAKLIQFVKFTNKIKKKKEEESACNAGDLGSILGSGRSPGEGNGNPLQCSCLENPMDRGAWLASP